MAEMYLVGGAVRDLKLGLVPKDLDFAVVAESFEDMKEWLMRKFSVEIFLETVDYGTIRGRFPQDRLDQRLDDFAGIRIAGQACDFVLCRKDGAYSDGRRPDEVEVGSLYDDLKRRDFTVNAMALAADGLLIDPFNGAKDLDLRLLRAVGDPRERFSEDALRLYRAVRFYITKGFSLSWQLEGAMRNLSVLDNLPNVSVERVREELYKCLKFDTKKTMKLLLNVFPELLDYVLDNGIWLMPTTKG